MKYRARYAAISVQQNDVTKTLNNTYYVYNITITWRGADTVLLFWATPGYNNYVFNHFFYCKQIRNSLGDLLIVL